MNNHKDAESSSSVNNERKPDDVALAKLMNLAGARPPISEIRQARVYGKVEQEWLRSGSKWRQIRRTAPFALAASLIVVIAILVDIGGVPTRPLGTVARIIGNTSEQGLKLTLNQAVYAGDTILTASGQYLSIALDHRSSLRIGPDTALRLDEQDSLTLMRGLVYADSGQLSDRNDGLTIHTRLGSVTDIGTQFSVQYSEDHVGVAVREGRVDIDGNDASFSIVAGNKLIVQDDGSTESENVPSNDVSWDWAVKLAPDFEMQSKSLLVFLEWAARETGKELIFTSDDTRGLAEDTLLHGSVSGFTPIEAIQSVLATTTFDYKINDTQLLIDK